MIIKRGREDVKITGCLYELYRQGRMENIDRGEWRIQIKDDNESEGRKKDTNNEDREINERDCIKVVIDNEEGVKVNDQIEVD